MYTQQRNTLYWSETTTDCNRASDFISKVNRFSQIIPTNPETIVDAGCSSGITTIEISELFPESRVIGVDVNKYQLTDSPIHRNLDEQSRISLLHKDYTTAIFPEGSIDLFLIMNSLSRCFLNDYELARNRNRVAAMLLNPCLSLSDKGVLLIGENNWRPNAVLNLDFGFFAIIRLGNTFYLTGDRQLYRSQGKFRYKTLSAIIERINNRADYFWKNSKQSLSTSANLIISSEEL